MDNIENILDEEATKLFQKLRGIDTSYGKDRLTESLEEERQREDDRKILIVELVHLLSSYLLDIDQTKESNIENETLAHFAETIDKLTEISPQKHPVLIRYRGFPNDPNVTEKDDYEIIYGNTIVDFAVIADIVKRIGYRMAHLSDQLSRAFNVFSTHNIFTLYMKIPGSLAKQKERFYDTLRAISRYKTAVETTSPIVFLNTGGKSMSFPLVCNESGQPDENLTLLAVANNLKPHTVDILVDKVGKSSLKERYMSTYNAIFAVKKLKGRLIKPPIEVNNIIWLLADQEKEIVTQEKAEVAQIALESAGGSPQKAAKVLKSVYGNDYEKIDSKNLGERLQLSSNLLDSVKKKPENQKIEKEILGNIETRLEQVQEKVFDDLFVQQGTDAAAFKKKLGIFGALHKTLLNMVTFYKHRIDTKKKMREIVHHAINFNLQDFETLGKDFDISIEEAKELIAMLKDCFDKKGRFVRGSFVRIMPEFARYERKIFEFLWHYLREHIHQKDRTAYLNSLQLLIARMQKPKKAIKILLSDFCLDASNIHYSDSKALMLCSLLIRKYSKELIDLEITPEDVLQVTEGLDKGVAKYTQWKIDKNRDNFFEKIRTIHQNLVKALDPGRKKAPAIPLPFLLSLEREAIILFSLVGGNTARSIVLSAVKDYGDPESMIYHGRESKKNLGALLQNLRIAIRGLGRVGGLDDLPVLDEVKGNEKRLAKLGKSKSYKMLVRRIMDRIMESSQLIIQQD